MRRTRPTHVLPLLAAFALGGGGTVAANPHRDGPPVDALSQSYVELHQQWVIARERWEAAPPDPAEGSDTTDAEHPTERFARDFEELAARGSAEAAFWRLRHHRGALGLAVEDELDSDQRLSLQAHYQRLIDEHAARVDLLVPELFDRLIAEGDLAHLEVDALCARIEGRSHHPEIRGHALLVRGLRTAPLGTDDAVAQVIAAKLFDRVVDECPGTQASIRAGEARWVLDHLSIGRRPPDFTTFDPAGNEIRLSDFEGRVVIVHFLGDDPDGADVHLEAASHLRRELWDERFTWIGIHGHPDAAALRMRLDEPDVLGTHAWEGGVERPAGEAWRPPRRPLAFLLDGSGHVRGIDVDEEELTGRVGELIGELPPVGSLSPGAEGGDASSQ